MEQVMKVEVVGAGAAGLCAVRLLACGNGEDEDLAAAAAGAAASDADAGGDRDDRRDHDVGCTGGGRKLRKNGFDHSGDSSSTVRRLDVTAFEQAPDIGGTWRYSEDIGYTPDGLPVHSSMYKHLRTNVPKECMFFPDFPFPDHLPSFLKHEDVLKYLEDYATHFGLRKHIQFRTRVERIKPILDRSNRFGVRWEVTTSKVKDGGDKQTQMFDAVVLSNGQYSIPRMPDIPGFNTFEGHVIHSHDYRVPDMYKGQIVAVLGGRLSGQDISIEVSDVAAKVFLCHDLPRFTTYLPPNLEQKPGIKKCNRHTVEFHDGETVEVDAIILCTGYNLDFSPLDDSVGVKVEDGRVTPLYKHFLCIPFPSLAIVSIIQYSLFFPFFYVQLKYFRHILNGSRTLPSQLEMIADEKQDYEEKRRKGFPHRYSHFLMGDDGFDYYDSLAELNDCERFPAWIRTIFKANLDVRLKDMTRFRDYNYIVDEDHNITMSSI